MAVGFIFVILIGPNGDISLLVPEHAEMELKPEKEFVYSKLIKLKQIVSKLIEPKVSCAIHMFWFPTGSKPEVKPEVNRK